MPDQRPSPRAKRIRLIAAPLALAACLLLLALTGCDSGRSWECTADSADPDYLLEIGCDNDFAAVAASPFSASIPGANSTKTVIDRLDGDALYFQNSRTYGMHWDFASAFLSGNGKPIVPLLSEFSQTEYFSPDRRFLLGAVTYYEGPGIWTYEISPYDTASAEMIETAFHLIADHAYFGDQLYFHPTSDAVAVTAADLPDSVPVITTDELFDGIDYQPLNLGTSMGQLRFVAAADLGSTYLGFRDIAVLDAVPNDISVVMGLITATFQTPLSHVNVLSQNRGTPNMGLEGAFDDPALRALEGKWVELEVGAFEYSVTEVTQDEADQWWDAHKPDPVGVPDIDLSVTDLRDIEEILDLDNDPLGDALAKAIPAFGGKASHFASFPHIEGIPYPKAFAVPVYYYRQFMEQNGFDTRVAEMLADTDFQNDPAVREAQLAQLRADMMVAPVDADFESALLAKLNTDYPGTRMRFRSSTNAEDLDGFTGAGLYTSKSGDPNDPLYPVLDAIREVWSSVWYFRAFEERSYRSIDHTAVGMALLVHHSFPDEEANGVAVTNNIFDTSGLDEQAFYVNVQYGGTSVVQPDPNITTDQFVYYFETPGQPIVFIRHSSLIPDGETVLTRSQTHELGIALDTIHDFFQDLYGQGDGFYAMDVEFKFDDLGSGGDPELYIKQARPYPGWGENP